MNQVKPKRKITRNGKTHSARRNNYKRTGGEAEAAVGVGSKPYQKAVQLRDKYRELAREALVSGDRVTAEGHYQYADHYNRIINAAHEIEEERSNHTTKDKHPEPAAVRLEMAELPANAQDDERAIPSVSHMNSSDLL